MKSSTLRLIVVLTLLAAGGIIATQVFWVRRAAALQERAFDLAARAALRGVVLDVYGHQEMQAPVYQPVERLQPGNFVLPTGGFVDKDVVQHFLVSRFTAENLGTDFEYALFDCSSDSLLYRGYYHMPGTDEQQAAPGIFTPLKKNSPYLLVRFPYRGSKLNAGLGLWSLSSALLLCVLAVLGYLLFVIFRQKRLRELQKDFVDNMTHEFRTPLSAIQLSADTLRNPAIAGQPERLQRYAGIISAQALHLASQVERVLQMTRAEKGRLEMRKEAFVWQELLEEMRLGFEQRTEGQDCSIAWELPPAPLLFKGDVLHLKNAIGNLLDNALKYCGDAPPDVVVSLRQVGRKIQLAVRDRGIGIEAAYQKMLFRKFFRVPTGNVHNVKGFGIGLNYVQAIARAHGGHVSCESSLGKGSIFTLTFPS